MTEHVNRQRWIAKCGGVELRYIGRKHGDISVIEALVVHDNGRKLTYLFRTPDDGVSAIAIGGRPSDEFIRCEFGLVKASAEDYLAHRIPANAPFAIPAESEAIDLGTHWYADL